MKYSQGSRVCIAKRVKPPSSWMPGKLLGVELVRSIYRSKGHVTIPTLDLRHKFCIFDMTIERSTLDCMCFLGTGAFPVSAAVYT